LKIPNKLKVGGINYKVIKNYEFIETELGGQALHTEALIRLSQKGYNNGTYTKEKQEEVFMHELLHCVDRIYNNGKLEEDVVDRLSQGLYQVLKDNKMLV
jgi:hypothetical protein